MSQYDDSFVLLQCSNSLLEVLNLGILLLDIIIELVHLSVELPIDE